MVSIHSRFSTTNAIAAETGRRAGIVTTTPFLGDTDMRRRLTPDLFIKRISPIPGILYEFLHLIGIDEFFIPAVQS